MSTGTVGLKEYSRQVSMTGLDDTEGVDVWADMREGGGS
jgi:hypothetical protein